MNTSIIGSYEQLAEIVDREGINKVIVAMPERRGKLPMDSLLSCKLHGVSVEDVATFYEQISGKIMLENLRPSWVVFSQGFSISPLALSLKRLMDVVLAIVALMFAAPLMVLMALMIKLNSRGPVFFTQERMGQGGKLFTLIKFRSMRDNAELTTGPVFAEKNDERITRVGRCLRAARLDELPQMFNVVKGEMSFVGPRPERPFFVEQFAKEIPYYTQRLSVKPGITGWAQINYSYGSNTEDALEKLRLDLYYIKNISLPLDIFILLKTAKIAILAQGAR